MISTNHGIIENLLSLLEKEQSVYADIRDGAVKGDIERQGGIILGIESSIEALFDIATDEQKKRYFDGCDY